MLLVVLGGMGCMDAPVKTRRDGAVAARVVDAGTTPSASPGAAGAAPDSQPAPVTTDAAAPPPTLDAAAPSAEAGGVVASGQGPVAEGKIVFSQDFEAGMDGITRSPTDLPAERAQIVDDPLGKRGKVLKITWQKGTTS
jgi:hypothetical protein